MKITKSAAQAERIILAMLEHCTQEKAAAALGMSVDTIRRWLRKPEHQELYLKARSDAYSHVVGRARVVAPSAAATLLAVIADPKAPPAVRLRASAAILRGANTFQFEDEKARLDRLQTKGQEEREETEQVPCKGQGNSGRSRASAAKIDRMALAVLHHGSVSKAAAACGVPTSTIWRWSQKPEFQEHCRKARYEKYSLAISVIQWAANTAMSTLIRLKDDEKVGIRVRAAEMILELARTGVQGDLEAAFVAEVENANEICETRIPLKPNGVLNLRKSK
jgi:DNA invertase Pin-like site-specific DNA recombinase